MNESKSPLALILTLISAFLLGLVFQGVLGILSFEIAPILAISAMILAVKGGQLYSKTLIIINAIIILFLIKGLIMPLIDRIYYHQPWYHH